VPDITSKIAAQVGNSIPADDLPPSPLHQGGPGLQSIHFFPFTIAMSGKSVHLQGVFGFFFNTEEVT